MELLSLQEVAKTTHTSIAFWRKQVHLRRIAVVKVGRLVRLRPEDLHSFLAAGTRPATTKGAPTKERKAKTEASTNVGKK
jgi:excisionase family DNA binding protein